MKHLMKLLYYTIQFKVKSILIAALLASAIMVVVQIIFLQFRVEVLPFTILCGLIGGTLGEVYITYKTFKKTGKYY